MLQVQFCFVMLLPGIPSTCISIVPAFRPRSSVQVYSRYLLMYRWCPRDPGSHTAFSLAAQPSQPDSDVECLETEEAIDEAESDEESGLPMCPICKPSLLCP